MHSHRPTKARQPSPAGSTVSARQVARAVRRQLISAIILLVICSCVIPPESNCAAKDNLSAARRCDASAVVPTDLEGLANLERLAELCLERRKAFRPITTGDLLAARASLEAAVARLDSRLAAAGPEGNEWRKYLRMQDLQRELASSIPDRSVLGAIYTRFIAGHEGLGLVWFRDVKQALEQYLRTAAGLNNPDMPGQFEQLMVELSQRLKQYGVRPTAEDALAIGQAIGWLDSAGQVPEVVKAVRAALLRPNLVFQSDALVIAAGLAEPVDDIRPVRDFILGTDVYSTAHTTGQTVIELVPDQQRAVLDALFYGTAVSEGVGYNGPVCIYNTSVSRLASRKRLWLDAEGLHALGAVSSAETKTTITDIRSRRGRALVECMAWRQALRKKPAAEYIAAQHAAARLSAQVDHRAAEAIADANRQFHEKFRRPLVERKLFPQQLRFSTDRQRLHVVALQADADQLAAPSSPPPLPSQTDAALAVHQSLINNFAATALAGMTVTQESFDAGIVKLLGEMPERLRDDDPGEPWAVGFAAALPISVDFADQQIRITIRGRRFIKAGEAYPGMDVTAMYKLVHDADGFRAVRQGPLLIVPPGTNPDEPVKLTSRQVVIKTLLEKRFGHIFEEEVRLEGFRLPGRWAKLGRLDVIHAEVRDGWLTIGWRCEKPEQMSVTAAR